MLSDLADRVDPLRDSFGAIIEPFPEYAVKLDYRCPRCKAITHYLPADAHQEILLDPMGALECWANREAPIMLGDLPIYRKAIRMIREQGIPLRFIERPLCARCCGLHANPSEPYYEFAFDQPNRGPIPTDVLDPYDLLGLASLLRGEEYDGHLCDGGELRSRIRHFIELVEAFR